MVIFYVLLLHQYILTKCRILTTTIIHTDCYNKCGNFTSVELRMLVQFLCVEISLFPSLIALILVLFGNGKAFFQLHTSHDTELGLCIIFKL